LDFLLLRLLAGLGGPGIVISLQAVKYDLLAQNTRIAFPLI
jgi:hypothetical protein